MPSSSRFLSTPSARRATDRRVASYSGMIISIHALREEGDLLRCADLDALTHFYPRPPRGGRRAPLWVMLPQKEFLSTPSARWATWTFSRSANRRPYFYPRPPRGGRPGSRQSLEPDREFLSTPSARRATASKRPPAKRHKNFYPRPPRGGRPTMPPSFGSIDRFLSTPSARRATSSGSSSVSRTLISIHALREEGDIFVHRLPVVFQNFYPRPPRGGRRASEPCLSAVR